jgi:hypothetical protein
MVHIRLGYYITAIRVYFLANKECREFLNRKYIKELYDV